MNNVFLEDRYVRRRQGCDGLRSIRGSALRRMVRNTRHVARRRTGSAQSGAKYVLRDK
ncbi:MAG: hypothetical protein LBP64_10340 [Tannerella sp.]|nr:hypothetical protein [Tannerella sp.]